MEKSDFKRLGSHLGLSPESIKPVSADREIDAALNRWPTLSVACNVFVAIGKRRKQFNQESAQHEPPGSDSPAFRDISANRRKSEKT